jgi:hypothetical protein
MNISCIKVFGKKVIKDVNQIDIATSSVAMFGLCKALSVWHFLP